MASGGFLAQDCLAFRFFQSNDQRLNVISTLMENRCAKMRFVFELMKLLRFSRTM